MKEEEITATRPSDNCWADALTFEDFRNQNGMTYWWASDVCLMLGYKDVESFVGVIQKVTRAFTSLDIDPFANIVRVEREDGRADYKLSRFACYLAAQNGNPRKPEVARMQAYFAAQVRQMEALKTSDAIERLVIRKDLIDGNKGLADAAHEAGVTNYARFMNRGFIGMYNMMNFQLAQRRGVDASKLYDTMGRAELAANLFRVTQTEARIRANGIKGQTAAEMAHQMVGCDVRRMVVENTMRTPEELPQEQPLPEARKALKQEYRDMKRIDTYGAHKAD